MNKHMIMLILAAGLAAAGYYCYQHGCMKKGYFAMNTSLKAICDPAKEDCSGLEDDLEL